jgi:hypothetical protein
MQEHTNVRKVRIHINMVYPAGLECAGTTNDSVRFIATLRPPGGIQSRTVIRVRLMMVRCCSASARRGTLFPLLPSRLTASASTVTSTGPAQISPFRVSNKRHSREDRKKIASGRKSLSATPRKYRGLLQPRRARGEVHISCGIRSHRIARPIKFGQHFFCGGISSSGCFL